MNLSKIAVKRPVTTTMILLIVVAFGVLSITKLKLAMLPNMNIPVAIVSTSYTGAGPEEIEKLITIPVEGVLGTVPGIDEITSTSSYGSSTVVVVFKDDVDIDNAALDMRERVDRIKGMLPEDASDPMVMKIDITAMDAIQMGVTSDDGNLVALKALVDDKIKGRFEKQDGVASVDLYGGLEKEINVTLKVDQLRGYGISESTIQQMLMAENRSVPTGSIRQGDQRMSMKVSGEFKTLDDIRNLPITTPKGTIIYLRDVAEVTEDFIEATSLVYIDGVPCISINVQKQSTANTVEVSKKVRAEMARIEQDMPGIKFSMFMDPADYINRAIGTVASSAVIGGLLAICILYVFLRSVRSTLIVGTAIPVSIIATFVLMYYNNISINLMSLGGLTLGVGMLVDNSIVVLESIYRKIEEGEHGIPAAIDGAREVATSVIASTLTTIAVFLPITFSGGITAQIFNELAMTIAFALISSLGVSLTFVPMASSILLKPGMEKDEFEETNVFIHFINYFGKALNWVSRTYAKVLAVALRRRKTVIAITAAFVVATLATLPIIGMDFMPTSDEGMVQINISTPRGSLLEDTQKVVDQVIAAVEDVPETDFLAILIGGSMGMNFGGSSTDTASIMAVMKPKAERDRSSQEVASAMSKLVKDIPGAEISVEAMGGSMGNYAGGGISITIKGDDTATLAQISQDFQVIMEGVEGVREVSTSVANAIPEAVIKINRSKAASYGLSSSAVSSVVNTAIAGVRASTFKIDGDEMDIRIRQDKESFDYLSSLENILIPTPTGMNVPLYEVAEISVQNMPVSISRENQQKYVSVSAAMDGADTRSVSNQIRQKLSQYPMPANYTWEFTGSTQQMDETFVNLGLALIMAILLVYMIMAAEFEHLIYPFIVMFSMPIALTGGIFGLFVMGETLAITGFLGLIMLAGIVINNAIVLVDYTNLLVRERGMDVHTALMTAGPVRLRPILMTTLTTVLALLPMMLSNAEGSEMMRGLAIVVVFGLTLSTLVTLVLIPVIYYSNSMRREKKALKKAKLKEKREAKKAAKKGLPVPAETVQETVAEPDQLETPSESSNQGKNKK